MLYPARKAAKLDLEQALRCERDLKMPVFVQLVGSFSTSGRFDTEKDTTSINRVLKNLQDDGAKILDVKLSFGSREHITTIVYIITYEAQNSIVVHEKR